MESVYCAVRTGCLHIIQLVRGLQRPKYADDWNCVIVSTTSAFAATRAAVLRTVRSEELQAVRAVCSFIDIKWFNVTSRRARAVNGGVQETCLQR